MESSVSNSVRPAMVKMWIACLAVAVAPWLTGGREPVGMLISAFALVLGALLVWREPVSRTLVRGPLWWSYVALMAFAVASCFWTANLYSSELWVAKWVMAGLAFRLAWAIAGEPSGRRWLLNAYLASAGIFTVAAIGMYMASDYTRLTGTFFWPNPAAAYLMPAILMAMEKVRLATQRPNFWWWVAALNTYLLAFWLTSSRATMVVLALVVAIFLAASSLKKRHWIIYVFSLVMAFGLSIALAWGSAQLGHTRVDAVPGSRSADAAAGSSRSVNDRLHYLQSAFEMWFAHPVAGTGAGTYGDVHPQFQHQVIGASADAHNVYVEVLAELGLVGAALLAAVVLWLALGMLTGLWRNGKLLPVVLSVVALGLHFGLDIDAEYPALLMLVAVLGAVAYEQWRTWPRGRASWGWPVAAILVLAPVISLYQSDVWAQRGKAAQANEEFGTAAQNFAQASRGVAYNPDWLNAQGINLLTAGGTDNLNRAIRLALEAQRQDPSDPQHYQLESRALSRQNKLAQAQYAIGLALKLDPLNHPEYAVDLAAIQVRRGNLGGAIDTANNMLALYPLPVLQNRSANQTLSPSLADLWAIKGAVALRQGQTELAKQCYREARSLDRTNARAQLLGFQLGLPGSGL